MALNDARAAAMLIDRKYGDDIRGLFDATRARPGARRSGFADDLALCAQLDSYPVVPVYQDRQITELGPRER